MTWYTLKSNSNKEIRYHVADEDNQNTDYVDVAILKEGAKETRVEYKIRPDQECDELSVETENLYIGICFENSRDHEDPFFSYLLTYTTTNVDELIDDIKKYILDLVKDSLLVKE